MGVQRLAPKRWTTPNPRNSLRRNQPPTYLDVHSTPPQFLHCYPKRRGGARVHIHRESDQLLARVSSPTCPGAVAVRLGATAAGAAEEADRYVEQVRHAYARRRWWRLDVHI